MRAGNRHRHPMLAGCRPFRRATLAFLKSVWPRGVREGSRKGRGPSPVSKVVEVCPSPRGPKLQNAPPKTTPESDFGPRRTSVDSEGKPAGSPRKTTDNREVRQKPKYFTPARRPTCVKAATVTYIEKGWTSGTICLTCFATTCAGGEDLQAPIRLTTSGLRRTSVRTV
jgi:hypothetical protein